MSVCDKATLDAVRARVECLYATVGSGARSNTVGNTYFHGSARAYEYVLTALEQLEGLDAEIEASESREILMYARAMKGIDT